MTKRVVETHKIHVFLDFCGSEISAPPPPGGGVWEGEKSRDDECCETLTHENMNESGHTHE